jgi:hypothetical protein
LGGAQPQIAAPITPEGFRHIYFRVDFQDTSGGLNNFKLSAAGYRNSALSSPSSRTELGFAGRDSGSGLPFSLTRGPLNSSVKNDTYSLEFAIPCNVTSNSLILDWFDADRVNGTPADTDINWTIRNVDTNQSVSLNNNSLGGNNVGETLTINSSGNFRVKAGDKYRWEWKNVDGNNGIQFVMPYSETTYNTTFCHDYKAGVGSTPSNTPRPDDVTVPGKNANVVPGQIVQFQARPRNKDGTMAGPDFNFRIRPQPGTDTASKVRLIWYGFQGPNTKSNGDGVVVPGTGSYLANTEDAVQWGTLGYSGDPDPGGIGGLGAGRFGEFRQYRFRVNDGASPGKICFQAGVSNYIGALGPDDWRDSPDDELCFNVIDDTNTGSDYKLENETISFGGKTASNSANGCVYVAAGEQINLGSSIENTGDGSTVTTGNTGVVDIRIEQIDRGSGVIPIIGNTTLNNLTISGNSGYNFNNNQGDGASIQVPLATPLGSTFGVKIYYVNTETLPAFIGQQDAEFSGLSGGAITNPGPRVVEGCVEVSDYAYMKVEGSGVYSGALWRTLEECIAGNFLTSVDANRDNIEDNFSRIQSNIATVGARTIGSSTEYGATSIFNPITGFASGIDDQSASIPANKNDQNKLSFANTGSEPGEFIGDDLTTISSNSIKCLPDLFGHLNDQEPVKFSLNDFGLTREEFLSEYGDVDSPLFYTDVNLPDRNGVLTNTTNGADDIPENPIVLIEATADNPAQFDHVLFAGDLKYTSNYGTFNGDLNIPGLVIIVKGDLRISGNVEQMDGLFIAIPSGVDSNGNTVGGNIYTCAEFETNNALCDRPLTINGALIANDVKFQRFSGGVAAAANSGGPQRQFASEIIRFSPELYISDPFAGVTSLLTNGGGFSDRYDYYKERPPIY